MAGSLDPRIIVLALGAGALGVPDALHFLAKIAGRSPLTDVAICVFAIAVVTAQALGAMLLARFVRKAARAPGATPRTDGFARMTLVVSLGVAFLVSACLLVASGAGADGLSLLHLVVAGSSMKSHVVAALATGAAVLPCARPLLRVFRRQEEDHSHGAAAASGSAGTRRYASMAQAATFAGAAAAAFLIAVSGVLYAQLGSLVVVGVATFVGTMLLAGFALIRKKARNAAGAGGRAAPTPAADARRVGGKLTRLAPYLAVVFVSFAAIICGLDVLTTNAPLESGPDGAKDP